MAMWRVNSNGCKELTVDEFLFCYEPCQIALSRGFWTFKNRDANTKVVQGLPSSDRIWKDKYFFVCVDNWERLPQEDPRDFVRIRRSWGIPSSPGVCFFLLVLFLAFASSSLPDLPLFFLCFSSVGSSATELRLAAEDFEDIGY